VVAKPLIRGHQRVLIDTSVWIYHFEENPMFGEAASRIIEELEAGRFRGIASELTLLEITVKPLQLGRQDAADDYETLLSYFPNLDLIPVNREILLNAASLGARSRLRTPDAIQVATAIASHATLAVTNDETWVQVPGIDVLLLKNISA
jgi:predicted nucleic acid-binding protein